MWRFISFRLLQAIPVILAVITMTFFLVRIAPGGPFDSEKAVMPEVKAALEAQYRLDQPLFNQYTAYLGDLAQGEFGPSFKYPGRSVNELIGAGLPVTAELGLYALLVAVIIGGLAGVMASLKPNTAQDYLPMSAAMIGICMPSFLLGPLLVLVFGIYLDWLPVSGWGDIPGDKILPSITLGSAYAAYIARLSRAGMLEVMSQDYIRTARAKGLPEWQVVTKHALRGGLIPVVAFLGPAFAGLLAGSFVVETIFQIPGLGRFYVQAAFNRDYTMILGTTVFLSTLIVLFNLLSDILAAWMNPRLRAQFGEK
ncbi:MAG: ABC transporter permease subunit [Halioglobus sp.]|jgi:oligopeptide transport system permease protein|uniref:ABC transporter permease subunit n=1 Tax=Candidatus Seongchinamella marina TaxID=2518990 RepID=A0ABT3SVH0_9GAMM|nr:ABC transporter permease subunit [Candidatus Seongchinamella marina]EEB78266.1 ABC transporter, permease protein [marine gamma proteobacterium HTCC2148]MBT3410629.1 ABC transporter permease subunit [Halieaceae bacterium]MDG1389742.1 ABC transporter permease subunit [Halioglobus sp.]MBT5006422.1 ABC transporter permease subunit [Halieaceae bacterium]MBT6124172.1 ABC transporter permease subunit [Halieaceae bacterium]